jgi:hypothetical protein
MPLILIEGHRASGKTFLIEKFFEQNTHPNIEYYKFQFANWIDELEMRDQETGPGVHYFSIANVLTILELNSSLLKDKTLVFDRCIFSAYVWSIYRERLGHNRLLKELKLILDNKLFQNIKVIYVNRDESISIKKRNKDYFGNFEDSRAESEIFERVFSEFTPQVTNTARNNEFIRFTNKFDDDSQLQFNKLLTSLL